MGATSQSGIESLDSRPHCEGEMSAKSGRREGVSLVDPWKTWFWGWPVSSGSQAVGFSGEAVVS